MHAEGAVPVLAVVYTCTYTVCIWDIVRNGLQEPLPYLSWYSWSRVYIHTTTYMDACVFACVHAYVCVCALNFLVHLLQVKALHKLKTISELLRKSTVSCVVGVSVQ